MITTVITGIIVVAAMLMVVVDVDDLGLCSRSRRCAASEQGGTVTNHH